MHDYDSDESIGELEPGKVSSYEEEEDRIHHANNTLYENYDNLNKITADRDFHPRSPVIYKPMHVYKGRVLHGVYTLGYGVAPSEYVQTLIINMGNVMNMYKYPVVDRAFSSAMVNWENLHLCGGWSWRFTGDLRKYNNMKDHEITVERVLGGLKPAGTIYGSLELIEEVAAKVTAAGFLAKHKFRPNMPKWPYEMMIANPKPFEELFDLDALDADYAKYFKVLGAEDITPKFSKLRGKSMADFMDLNIDWCSPVGMYVVGLILGYPVESTVHFYAQELQ